MDLCSRDMAKGLGLKRYFTGRPCSAGHIDERLVSNYRCMTCHRAAYRERFPAGSEARAQRVADYYWRNKVRENGRSRKWREENLDYARKRVRDWLAANKERRRLHERNYRARKAAAEGSHTTADIHWLFARQKARCAACRCSISDGFHVDHIQPLTKGGGNGRRNLQLLCAPCNLSKNAKDPIVWAQENGRLL